MTTVFIAGSISISRLHEKVQERINNIVSSNFNVVVGDADGADTSIQECLHGYRANNVTVFCSGDKPRNNVAAWPVHKVYPKAKPGSRAYFTAKDLEMARSSDFGLMIWDCKSTGTLSNVIELLKEKKKSVVFVDKNKDFITIADKAGLDSLLHLMSENARTKAEEKIGLSERIAELSQEQFLFEGDGDKSHPSSQANQADSVFEITPDIQVHPESMKLRSELISALKDFIRRTHLSQSQAAKLFGVTQPRISDLTRGKIELFGLDALVNMASLAGLHVEMHVRDNL